MAIHDKVAAFGSGLKQLVKWLTRILSSMLSFSKRRLDRLVSPRRQAQEWQRLNDFAKSRPLEASFAALFLLLSVIPLLTFASFTAGVIVFSACSALFWVSLGLLFLVPTLFISFGVALCLWATGVAALLVARFVYERLGGDALADNASPADDDDAGNDAGDVLAIAPGPQGRHGQTNRTNGAGAPEATRGTGGDGATQDNYDLGKLKGGFVEGVQMGIPASDWGGSDDEDNSSTIYFGDEHSPVMGPKMNGVNGNFQSRRFLRPWNVQKWATPHGTDEPMMIGPRTLFPKKASWLDPPPKSPFEIRQENARREESREAARQAKAREEALWVARREALQARAEEARLELLRKTLEAREEGARREVVAARDEEARLEAVREALAFREEEARREALRDALVAPEEESQREAVRQQKPQPDLNQSREQQILETATCTAEWSRPGNLGRKLFGHANRRMDRLGPMIARKTLLGHRNRRRQRSRPRNLSMKSFSNKNLGDQRLKPMNLGRMLYKI